MISDLIEFRCSQNPDVSVGPPAQVQLLAVSWDTDTKRRQYRCEMDQVVDTPTEQTLYNAHTHKKGELVCLPSLT